MNLFISGILMGLGLSLSMSEGDDMRLMVIAACIGVALVVMSIGMNEGAD